MKKEEMSFTIDPNELERKRRKLIAPAQRFHSSLKGKKGGYNRRTAKAELRAHYRDL